MAEALARLSRILEPKFQGKREQVFQTNNINPPNLTLFYESSQP